MAQNNFLEELDLDGFQVVKSDMFAHIPWKSVATCTIWPTKISFSYLTLEKLNKCDYIMIRVNPTSKCILVIPCPSTDKDSIRWTKGVKEKKIRNMESKQFGEQLYKSWKLDPELAYRATGRLVSSNSKLMMLFDFKEADAWRIKKPTTDEE